MPAALHLKASQFVPAEAVVDNKTWLVIRCVFWPICFLIGIGIGYLPKNRPFQVKDVPRIPMLLRERIEDYQIKRKQKKDNAKPD